MIRKILATLLLTLFWVINSFGAPVLSSAPPLSSPSAILMDAKTGEILTQKSAYEKRPMASTTKIMTAILVLERKPLGKKVIAGQEATNAGGAELYLSPGEEITVEQLLYGMMLKSANDASMVLAGEVGKTTSNFINLMNKKAKSIGTRGTSFANPHGLHDINHYSTAFDLALMARYGLKNPIFAKVVSTKEYVIPWPGNPYPRQFKNHNKLLWQYPYANGVKTGYIKESGYCLVAAATKNGVRLISVVLASPTSQGSYEETIKLLEYGFNQFRPERVIKKGEAYKRVNLPSLPGEKLDLIAARNLTILGGEGIEIRKVIKAKKSLSLPILKNQKLGQIIAVQGDQKLGEVDLISPKKVPKPSLAKRMYMFFKSLP